MLSADFGVGQVLWSMFWFFIFVIWIMLLFRVFADIFRSRDMGGVAKTLWVLFVIVAPYLGVFIYLIARGGKMMDNALEDAARQEESLQGYIRQAAGTTSVADELARLAELHGQGTIDDAEYAALKAKAIG
jgi:hypothetical protein